ncbi:MAG: 2-dehydro-3-deoxygalactonokinase [Verrucomicrobiales bacterium]|nr:2-dehydro-3-deoxygalactonokinase [Verrucomicrobiales bacterium]
MPTPDHTLIAVDWGSTNLRARLVCDGQLVATASSADGIRHRNGRDYDDILADLCGAWKEAHPEARVLMSGMIGSREGWQEAPYAPAPAGVADLAARLIRVTSRHFGRIEIVPGVRWDDPDTGLTDVMRGEETQIAGLLPDLPSAGAVVCLPGTHSKWVLCHAGRIERFRTWFTGEAFDLLTRGSLIAGSGAPADPACGAFARGIDLSATGGGLLHHLFLGRTEMLTGRVAPDDLRSLISGVLIGHEIREAVPFTGGLPIYLAGDSPAAVATASALQIFAIPHHAVPGESQLAGLLAIAGAG